MAAPIDRIPVFARGGSIIPMRQGLTHAVEDNDDPVELHIYTGSDGEFLFYDDAGDDYSCENGEFERIRMSWSDRDRILTIGEREGSFAGMKAARRIRLFVNGSFSQEAGYIDSRMEIRL